MERLLLPVPLLLSLLSLVHCYYNKTGDVCNSIPFFPGHNLMGEGYDIVTRTRKGAYLIDTRTFMTPNGTCHVFRNRFQGNQEQKLPLSTVDLRLVHECQFDFRQTRQSSVSDLISALTDQDTSDWKVGLSLDDFGNVDVGGTRSKEYDLATRKVNEDKFHFSIHRRFCRLYRYRVSDTPPLSAEFKKDASSLPSSYSTATKVQYRRFINTYGTHYIREASLGGQFRRITAVRTCLASMNGLSSSTAHICLSLGIRVGLGKDMPSENHRICTDFLLNNNKATTDHREMHEHRTEVTGGRGWTGELSLLSNNSHGYDTWLQSIGDHPDIVHYSLWLMSALVPDPSKRPHVEAAIEDYLKENSISKSEGRVSDCPKELMIGYLTVTIDRAWNLFGDDWCWSQTDGYVEMEYGFHRNKTQVLSSDNPVWNAYYDLGKVDTHLPLLIKVWDEDHWYDDLLISCSRYLTQGSHSFTCTSNLGTVQIYYTLRCYSHLTGDHCEHYKPSP